MCILSSQRLHVFFFVFLNGQVYLYKCFIYQYQDTVNCLWVCILYVLFLSYLKVLLFIPLRPIFYSSVVFASRQQFRRSASKLDFVRGWVCVFLLYSVCMCAVSTPISAICLLHSGEINSVFARCLGAW